MSVLITLQAAGDGAQLEQAAQSDPERIERIMASAKSQGLIAHHFWASDDSILVVDEWPDAESFQTFFSSETDIPQFMADAGITTQPSVTVWRKLNTNDDYRA